MSTSHCNGQYDLYESIFGLFKCLVSDQMNDQSLFGDQCAFKSITVTLNTCVCERGKIALASECITTPHDVAPAAIRNDAFGWLRMLQRTHSIAFAPVGAD